MDGMSPHHNTLQGGANRIKTGTTTVGIVVKDAVILGADKRATMGYYVASKTADKIHMIRDHVGATIAGSVADAQYLLDFMTARAKLYELEQGRKIPINTLVKLFAGTLFSAKYPMPYEVQHLVGGVDDEGPKLYDIGGDGSILKEEYASTGSGSVFAYGVLEVGYKENMSIEEGVDLVIKAVKAAISRDIFTGQAVDIIIITSSGHDFRTAKIHD